MPPLPKVILDMENPHGILMCGLFTCSYVSYVDSIGLHVDGMLVPSIFCVDNTKDNLELSA